MQRANPTLSCIIALLPMLFLTAGLWFFFDSDRELTLFFNSHRYYNPDCAEFFKIITKWGNPLLYLCFIAIYWRASRRSLLQQTNPMQAIKDRAFVLAWIVAQVCIAFLFVRVLKVAVGYPRPNVEGTFQPFSLDPRYNSFPSGHTVEIVGSILPLCMRGWWAKYCLYLVPFLLGCYASLIAFSRIYLSQHHVSDMFFAIFIGFCSFLLWQRLVRYFIRKQVHE